MSFIHAIFMGLNQRMYSCRWHRVASLRGADLVDLQPQAPGCLCEFQVELSVLQLATSVLVVQLSNRLPERTSWESLMSGSM